MMWQDYVSRLLLVPEAVTSGEIDTFLELPRVWSAAQCQTAEVETESKTPDGDNQIECEIDRLLLLSSLTTPRPVKPGGLPEAQVERLIDERNFLLQKVGKLHQECTQLRSQLEDGEQQAKIDAGVKEFLQKRVEELEGLTESAVWRAHVSL
mmetsp:Transcript_42778/g.100625  ORF Transcript_42778/g.100625 Transcript_42778/m.100625 type:complete len:152 (+) Transcript_42778:295-750(+)